MENGVFEMEMGIVLGVRCERCERCERCVGCGMLGVGWGCDMGWWMGAYDGHHPTLPMHLST